MKSEVMPGATALVSRETNNRGKRPTMPGPKTLTRFGWYAYSLPKLTDPVVSLLNLQAKYGDIVSLGQDKKAPVIVFGPKYNHQIMSDPDLFYCLDTSSKDSLVH